MRTIPGAMRRSGWMESGVGRCGSAPHGESIKTMGGLRDLSRDGPLGIGIGTREGGCRLDESLTGRVAREWMTARTGRSSANIDELYVGRTPD